MSFLRAILEESMSSEQPPLSDRQIATILAALRFYQNSVSGVRDTEMQTFLHDISSNMGEFEPLDQSSGIDSLCQQLNPDAPDWKAFGRTVEAEDDEC